jgi:hypothetical protein
MGSQAKGALKKFRDIRRNEAMTRQGNFLDEVNAFLAENPDVPLRDARQIVAVRRRTEREYQKEQAQ